MGFTGPTPDGVPDMTKSPARNVMNLDNYRIISETLQIILARSPHYFTAPVTLMILDDERRVADGRHAVIRVLVQLLLHPLILFTDQRRRLRSRLRHGARKIVG